MEPVSARRAGNGASRNVAALLAVLCCALIGSLPAAAQYTYALPLVWYAGDPSRQGFVRLATVGVSAARVTVTAQDANGVTHGSFRLTIPGAGAVHFNSNDLEYGNRGKGIVGVGNGTDVWHLTVTSNRLIDAMAFMRTSSGFLTSMHDFARHFSASGGGRLAALPILNPGSNTNQVGMIFLVNPNRRAVRVELVPFDDFGRTGRRRAVVNMPAGYSRVVSAANLEVIWGDGTGKWSVLISSNGVVYAQSLLFSRQTGLWTNLTTEGKPSSQSVALDAFSSQASDGGEHLPAPALAALVARDRVRLGNQPPVEPINLPLRMFEEIVTVPASAPALHAHTLPFVPAGRTAGLQGMVRIVNRSARGGTVRIDAFDDAGNAFGPVSVAMAASEVVSFTSVQLEEGTGGLPSGIGTGEGNWQLTLSTDLDIQPGAYARTSDGAMSSLNDVVEPDGFLHHVAGFHPGESHGPRSLLRVVNPTDIVADVIVNAVDDKGIDAPAGTVRFTLPPRAARTFTADALESGIIGTDGRLGDGAGTWRLVVSSGQLGLVVMNLQGSGTGGLTSLPG